MKNIILFLISLMMPVCFLVSQEDTGEDAGNINQAPSSDEMEIVIPTILLEVEEEKLALIEAPLPGDEDRELSDFVLSLPDVPDLEVSPLQVEASEFLDLSSLVMGGDSEGTDAEDRDSWFFSTGLIGGGTGSRVLGDIVLYKLGPSPRFQLQFYHEGQDSFGGHLAGEGYFINDNRLSGNLEIEKNNIDTEIELEYKENEMGLQEQTVFSSMTLRHYTVNGNLNWKLSELFDLQGGCLFTVSDQWLSGTNPPGYSGFTFNPALSLGMNTSFSDLELTAGYRWENAGADGDADTNIHGISALFSAESRLSSGIDLSGNAGVLWIPGNLPEYSGELKIQGEPGNFFIYSIFSRIAREVSMKSLWDEYPWIKPLNSSGDSLDLAPLLGWSGLFYLRFNPSGDLSLDTEIEYRYLENGFIPSLTESDGLSSISRGEINSLFTAFSLDWNFLGDITLSAGWKGQIYFDQEPMDPLHSVTGEISWDPGETFGGSVFGKYDIYGENQSLFTDSRIPEIGFKGFIGITEGIRFILEGDDLFSPLLDSGRLVWDNYEDTGFAVTMKLGISL